MHEYSLVQALLARVERVVRRRQPLGLGGLREQLRIAAVARQQGNAAAEARCGEPLGERPQLPRRAAEAVQQQRRVGAFA